MQYLNKQTTALREVNDSRLRIYEQVPKSKKYETIFFFLNYLLPCAAGDLHCRDGESEQQVQLFIPKVKMDFVIKVQV